LVARAHLVASQEHVALAVGQVVQHDEVQVDLLGAVPVLGLQRERARVGRGRVVDGERRRGASLVLLQPDGPLLAARHLALLRVDPGELRGRFASAFDLPTRGPGRSGDLGARLSLVDGRRQVLVSAEVRFGVRGGLRLAGLVDRDDPELVPTCPR